MSILVLGLSCDPPQKQQTGLLEKQLIPELGQQQPKISLEYQEEKCPKNRGLCKANQPKPQKSERRSFQRPKSLDNLSMKLSNYRSRLELSMVSVPIRRLGEEESKFEASLGYIVRSYLKQATAAPTPTID
jgi:hypothetical protein